MKVRTLYYTLTVGVLPTMEVKEEQEREGVTPEKLDTSQNA